MSKEKWEQIYEKYCEQRAVATDDVREAYKNLNEAFDVYLSAISEDEFRNAFMYGYMYAKAEMQKGGAVNV